MTSRPAQQRLLLMLDWLRLRCSQPRRVRVLLGILLDVTPERCDGRRALLLALFQQGLDEPAMYLCRQLREDGEEEPDLWRYPSCAGRLAGRFDAAHATHAWALGLEVRERAT